MVENLLNEEWAAIENSYYCVSNYGRIKVVSHQRFHNINKTFYTTKEKLKKSCTNNSKKYHRVQIFYKNGEKRIESCHRLVAIYFIDNPENKPQVNHKDGNKNNNYFENLEWVTNEENMKHRYEVLKSFIYLKNNNCKFKKLNENQVLQIPSLLKTHSKKQIAELFNVCPTTITEITNGRSWTYLNLFPYRKKKSSVYNLKDLGLRDSPTLLETGETQKETFED